MNTPDREHERILAHPISGGSRAALAIVGLISWLAGGAATFLNKNGVGAAALVAVGVACGVLALMGRWPSRISMSGNELSWDEVHETVDSQILMAEKSDDPDSVLVELKDLRARLNTLQRTGTVPEHPAESYDRAVEAALRRLLRGAEVIRQELRSRDIADFVVRYQGQELFAETKWRADVSHPFGGSTLPRLLNRLGPDAKLLVIVNASEPPLARAFSVVEEALGKRGRIVTWRDVRDDEVLGAALAALLERKSADGKNQQRNGG